MGENIQNIKYKNINVSKELKNRKFLFYLSSFFKCLFLLFIILLTFKDFFYFHHGNPFKSWHEFYYTFVSWWIIWFTEWITTLNFFICIAFLVINILLALNLAKIKNLRVYTFFKVFNTVYMLYMFLIYNLLLLFYSKAITDYNPVTHKITNASVIEHIINPLLWFAFCLLDDKMVKFKEFNTNFSKIRYSLLRSLYILSFIFSYFVFTEIRNYLIHINIWNFVSHEGYIYLDIYKIGFWKVMMFAMIGFLTFFSLSNMLFLFYIYKNDLYKKIKNLWQKNKLNKEKNKDLVKK